MVIFETERLIVRTYIDADMENFFLLNGNEELMQYIRAAKSREECAVFLKEVIAAAKERPLYGRWAANEKSTGNFVGSFAIIPVENTGNMQMGYAFLKPFWGKGFATEITKEGLNYVFTKTDIDIIYAYAEEPNVASRKVLLKCGFQQMATKTEGVKTIVKFAFTKSVFQLMKQPLSIFL